MDKPRSYWRKIAKVIAWTTLVPVALLVIFLLIGYLNGKMRLAGPNLQWGITDPTPVRIQVGDYEYDIPQNHLDMPSKMGCRNASELMWALWPNLEGRTKENFEEFLKAGGAAEVRRVTILMNSGPPHPKKIIQSRFQYEINKDADGRNGRSHERRPFNYGLSHYKGPFPSPLAYASDDIYLPTGAEDDVASLIKCSAFKPRNSPRCSHIFLYRDLWVKFTYWRHQLPEWRESESKVRGLLDKWFVGKAPPGRLECPGQYFPTPKNSS